MVATVSNKIRWMITEDIWLASAFVAAWKLEASRLCSQWTQNSIWWQKMSVFLLKWNEKWNHGCLNRIPNRESFCPSCPVSCLPHWRWEMCQQQMASRQHQWLLIGQPGMLVPLTFTEGRALHSLPWVEGKQVGWWKNKCRNSGDAVRAGEKESYIDEMSRKEMWPPCGIVTHLLPNQDIFPFMGKNKTRPRFHIVHVQKMWRDVLFLPGIDFRSLLC